MKKLSDLVEIEHNDETCIILKVKPNKNLDLIKLGYFDGAETMFRVTKGKDHRLTVWDDSGKSYGWGWGASGDTLISDSCSQMQKLIMNTIEKDFGVIMEGKGIPQTLYLKPPSQYKLAR